MNTPAKLPDRGPRQPEPALRLFAFSYADPMAEAVYLVGDFNHWNPNSHHMLRRADGSWRLEVPLPAGSHRYLFLVDGRPTLDPQGTGVARNENGEAASILVVS